MRIAFDTNLLIAALASPRSAAARILGLWREGRLELVESEATLAEARLVAGASWLSRIASPVERDALLAEIEMRSVLIDAPELPDLTLRDAGDRRLVEAAVAGGASYLVTADREVLLMRGYGSVQFVTAGELLRAISRGASDQDSPRRPPSGSHNSGRT
jgi:putative PIN family toxin of toxin-antitoxin system